MSEETCSIYGKTLNNILNISLVAYFINPLANI
jgi:hypothetical protein